MDLGHKREVAERGIRQEGSWNRSYIGSESYAEVLKKGHLSKKMLEPVGKEEIKIEEEEIIGSWESDGSLREYLRACAVGLVRSLDNTSVQ
ncbi:hypothetical protein L6452_42332 [Arctium lappa]|uniref:Uncharacterized protein n=1 Tax=Arctium lappa TaxID=4217 RepID=A0ACB8XIK0_ARCLA|nr:hypothetical protein L6452_42332 [Arctium lappa]